MPSQTGTSTASFTPDPYFSLLPRALNGPRPNH